MVVRTKYIFFNKKRTVIICGHGSNRRNANNPCDVTVGDELLGNEDRNAVVRFQFPSLSELSSKLRITRFRTRYAVSRRKLLQNFDWSVPATYPYGSFGHLVHSVVWKFKIQWNFNYPSVSSRPSTPDIRVTVMKLCLSAILSCSKNHCCQTNSLSSDAKPHV